MGKFGSMIAKAVPPPGKLGRGLPAMDDGDGPDAEGASDEDADHAAELSVAEAFQQAVKSGSAEDVLSAYKDLMDTCKGY